jgi:hypothetical protein
MMTEPVEKELFSLFCFVFCFRNLAEIYHTPCPKSITISDNLKRRLWKNAYGCTIKFEPLASTWSLMVYTGEL